MCTAKSRLDSGEIVAHASRVVGAEIFPFLIFLLIAAAVVGLIGYAIHSERKRREALAAIFAGIGLEFSTERDSSLVQNLRFLNQLRHGENRYACNVARGSYQGYAVTIFDFHYETSSTDSKGNRSKTSHWHHLITLRLPRAFPELTISRENIFTRAAQAFGWPAITFESHEFSRTFLVRSKDKRFAYDICHPRMMEFLLANRDLAIEIDSDVWALIFSGTLKPERVVEDLNRMIALRELMPEYLFDSTPPPQPA